MWDVRRRGLVVVVAVAVDDDESKGGPSIYDSPPIHFAVYMLVNGVPSIVGCGTVETAQDDGEDG
jgi:hypothetical protein